MSLYKEGVNIWVKGLVDTWVQAEIYTVNENECIFKYADGTKEIHNCSVKGNWPPLCNDENQSLVEDLINLNYLNEPSVLHCLKTRFLLGIPYTYSGIVFIAINPIKSLPSLYNDDLLMTYRGQKKDDMEPHIYGVAESTFDSLQRYKQSQSIIISGESGAGKTFTAKLAMKYLVTVGKVEKKDSSGFENRIAASTIILETLGNAHTSKNNNSSRFGKLVQIQFNRYYELIGVHIQTYCLEKSRVTSHEEGELNFHIFYNMLAQLSANDKTEWGLTNPNDFLYTRQEPRIGLNGVNGENNSRDLNGLNNIRRALRMVNICEFEERMIFQTLAGILHLGNIHVIGLHGSTVPNQNVYIQNASRLLAVSSKDLVTWLSFKRLVAGKEVLKKMMTEQQSLMARDSLAKIIYQRLFDWIVSKINQSLKASSGPLFIGILDMTGFERLSKNSFEQFCINYANENLQRLFNQQILAQEQRIYMEEGIQWSFIGFVDNLPCVDLIEKGIFPSLDEECALSNCSSINWVNKLYQRFGSHEYFIVPRFSTQRGLFSIKHYGHPVIYDSREFIAKNTDTIAEALLNTMRASREPFLRHLFDPIKPTITSDTPPKPIRKCHTVGYQFRKSLSSLMTILKTTNTHYVRCIQPNPIQSSNQFHLSYVWNQLKACGVMETIKISAAGYSSRIAYNEFYKRYVLFPGQSSKANQKAACVELLHSTLSSSMYQVGQRFIFLKEGQLGIIERKRNLLLYKYAIRIQSMIRCYVARKNYLRLQLATLCIQTFWRGFNARRYANYIKRLKAVICIQTSIPQQLAINQLKAWRQYSNDVLDTVATHKKQTSELKLKIEEMEKDFRLKQREWTNKEDTLKRQLKKVTGPSNENMEKPWELDHVPLEDCQMVISNYKHQANPTANKATEVSAQGSLGHSYVLARGKQKEDTRSITLHSHTAFTSTTSPSKYLSTSFSTLVAASSQTRKKKPIKSNTSISLLKIPSKNITSLTVPSTTSSPILQSVASNNLSLLSSSSLVEIAPTSTSGSTNMGVSAPKVINYNKKVKERKEIVVGGNQLYDKEKINRDGRVNRRRHVRSYINDLEMTFTQSNAATLPTIISSNNMASFSAPSTLSRSVLSATNHIGLHSSSVQSPCQADAMDNTDNSILSITLKGNKMETIKEQLIDSGKRLEKEGEITGGKAINRTQSGMKWGRQPVINKPERGPINSNIYKRPVHNHHHIPIPLKGTLSKHTSSIYTSSSSLVDVPLSGPGIGPNDPLVSKLNGECDISKINGLTMMAKDKRDGMSMYEDSETLTSNQEEVQGYKHMLSYHRKTEVDPIKSCSRILPDNNLILSPLSINNNALLTLDLKKGPIKSNMHTVQSGVSSSLNKPPAEDSNLPTVTPALIIQPPLLANSLAHSNQDNRDILATNEAQNEPMNKSINYFGKGQTKKAEITEWRETESNNRKIKTEFHGDIKGHSHPDMDRKGSQINDRALIDDAKTCLESLTPCLGKDQQVDSPKIVEIQGRLLEKTCEKVVDDINSPVISYTCTPPDSPMALPSIGGPLKDSGTLPTSPVTTLSSSMTPPELYSLPTLPTELLRNPSSTPTLGLMSASSLLSPTSILQYTIKQETDSTGMDKGPITALETTCKSISRTNQKLHSNLTDVTLINEIKDQDLPCTPTIQHNPFTGPLRVPNGVQPRVRKSQFSRLSRGDLKAPRPVALTVNQSGLHAIRAPIKGNVDKESFNRITEDEPPTTIMLSTNEREHCVENLSGHSTKLTPPHMEESCISIAIKENDLSMPSDPYHMLYYTPDDTKRLITTIVTVSTDYTKGQSILAYVLSSCIRYDVFTHRTNQLQTLTQLVISSIKELFMESNDINHVTCILTNTIYLYCTLRSDLLEVRKATDIINRQLANLISFGYRVLISIIDKGLTDDVITLSEYNPNEKTSLLRRLTGKHRKLHDTLGHITEIITVLNKNRLPKEYINAVVARMMDYIGSYVTRRLTLRKALCTRHHAGVVERNISQLADSLYMQGYDWNYAERLMPIQQAIDILKAATKLPSHMPEIYTLTETQVRKLLHNYHGDYGERVWPTVITTVIDDINTNKRCKGTEIIGLKNLHPPPMNYSETKIVPTFPLANIGLAFLKEMIF